MENREELAKKLGEAILGILELQVKFAKELCKGVKDPEFRADIFWMIFIGGKEIDADSKTYKDIKEWIDKICKETNK